MACQYGRLISYAVSHRPLLIVFRLCVSRFSEWYHHRSFCLLFDMVPSVFGEPLFSITELSWLIFLYPSWVKPLAGSGQSVLMLRELHHFTLWYIGHCLLPPVLFNLSIWCVWAHACGSLALTLAVPLSCLRGRVPPELCLLAVVGLSRIPVPAGSVLALQVVTTSAQLLHVFQESELEKLIILSNLSHLLSTL